MLSNLYIENIAVIEQANIDFKDGFNVLTGETGAGKSIVIDAINCVLGNRTSKQIIRTGSTSAFVSATFHEVSDVVIRKVRSLGFEIEDDCLILQRELNSQGKNNCRINSRPASLSALREIGTYLIGIHGQNDTLELISPALHMYYIDSLSDMSDVMKDYRQTYMKLKEVESKLNENVLDEEKRSEELDLLNYQINEIEDACIEVGEWEKLKEEKTVLNNSEKILRSLYKASAILDGDGDMETSVIRGLDEVNNEIINTSKFYSDAEELADRTSNAYYELQDISSEIQNIISDIGVDPQRIDEIEERLDIIYKLSKKYGPDEEDILQFLEDAKKRFRELNDYSSNRIQLSRDYELLLDEAKKKAQIISDIRMKTAAVFVKDVEKEMAYLEMPHVKLVVDRKECELNKRGFDEIEFLFSVNPGEEPKPVSKIASGGELSRMMLAIKTVLSKNDFIQTLIFDEIDTGISGSSAEKVGLKLKQISKDKQVMCVTHQAQIAALADTHFLISKDIDNDRTYTSVKELDFDGRVKEVARIIDGVSVTNTAIEHAKQLICKDKE